MHTIAIYGGTFDPVHKAHIATALAIQNYFHFQTFYFVPCKDPLIKAASKATAKQRVAMLQLAIEDYPDFQIDQRELFRDSPSYMVETLASFRQENLKASITLIIGYDAFLALPLWHEWQKLTSLANILVIKRPEATRNITTALIDLLKKHQVKNAYDLLNYRFGKIVEFDAGNYAISSTRIRQKISQSIQLENDLSSKVFDYIKTHGLYKGEL